MVSFVDGGPVFSGNGIPDAMEFKLLETVLKDATLDLGFEGGVMNGHVYQDWLHNLAQAQADFAGAPAAFQHAVALSGAAEFLRELALPRGIMTQVSSAPLFRTPPGTNYTESEVPPAGESVNFTHYVQESYILTLPETPCQGYATAAPATKYYSHPSENGRGTVVAITAHSLPGYCFVGWDGDGNCWNTKPIPDAPPTSWPTTPISEAQVPTIYVEMDDAMTVTAKSECGWPTGNPGKKYILDLPEACEGRLWTIAPIGDCADNKIEVKCDGVSIKAYYNGGDMSTCVFMKRDKIIVFFKKDGLFTAWFHVTDDQESYDERTENVRDYVAYAYNLLCDAALQCVRYANTEGWHYYAGPQPPYTTDPEEIPCP